MTGWLILKIYYRLNHSHCKREVSSVAQFLTICYHGWKILRCLQNVPVAFIRLLVCLHQSSNSVYIDDHGTDTQKDRYIEGHIIHVCEI